MSELFDAKELNAVRSAVPPDVGNGGLNFLAYLEAQVGKAIYVWGAQGQNLTNMTEAQVENFVKVREAYSSEFPNVVEANILRDMTLYRRRAQQGIDPILAFDCSGLIMYFLLNLTGEVEDDYNARGIYSKLCDYHPDKAELAPGDLVFKGESPSKITHVGVYVGDGQVIESYGRDVGVIRTELSSRPFKYTGHCPLLDKYLRPADGDHPVYSRVCSPMKSGEEYKAMQIKLNADGFTDSTGAQLVEDGKWGKKSLAAFNKFLQYQEENK